MKNKIILIVLMTALVLCAFTGCTDVMSLQAEIATLESERDMYADQAKDLEKKNSNYKSEVDKYKDIKKEYESYKSAMAEYEGLAEAEAEARRIEAEKAIQESKEAAEKASIAEKESKEAEKASKEAEEALGYETGIAYDQLARTPDDFKDKKVKFTGKVLQVMEDPNKDFVHIRFAVDSDYNSVLYCEYKTNIVTSRILEDDIITIYGTSYGLFSYESTSGATITIPAVIIDKIDTKTGGNTSTPGNEESNLTTGQKNALKKALSYLNLSAFSRSGLIKQLEFEGFTTEEATYAVDNSGADWNEQAVKKAASYLRLTAFSKEGLIHQLEFEGFTHEQAVYGAEQNGY